MLELGSHVSASGGVDKSIERATNLQMTSFQIFTKNANQWNAKPLDPLVIEQFRQGILDNPSITPCCCPRLLSDQPRLTR